jgi:hypothetical protein
MKLKAEIQIGSTPLYNVNLIVIIKFLILFSFYFF